MNVISFLRRTSVKSDVSDHAINTCKYQEAILKRKKEKEKLWSNFLARCNEPFCEMEGTIHAVICSVLLQEKIHSHFAKRDHAPAKEIRFMKLIDHIMWVLQHCGTSSQNLNDMADKKHRIRQSQEWNFQRTYPTCTLGRIKLVVLVNIASGRFRC